VFVRKILGQVIDWITTAFFQPSIYNGKLSTFSNLRSWQNIDKLTTHATTLSEAVHYKGTTLPRHGPEYLSRHPEPNLLKHSTDYNKICYSTMNSTFCPYNVFIYMGSNPGRGETFFTRPDRRSGLRYWNIAHTNWPVTPF